MYGRVAPGSQAVPQVAKTFAVGAGGGIAPTAFGSLSLGKRHLHARASSPGQRFALTATGIIVGRQPGVAHVLVNDHPRVGQARVDRPGQRSPGRDRPEHDQRDLHQRHRARRITRSPLRDGDVVIVGEPDCLSLQIRLGPS